MSRELTDPHPYEQPLLTLALILVCVFLVYTQAAKRLDLLAYDTAIKAVPAKVAHDLVIVSIDEKSLNGIGQWPWRRAIHAQLVDKLNSYNAALISFDVLFTERDANHPDDDQIFASAVQSSGNVILPMHINPLSYGNTLTELLPIPELIDSAKTLGHVHVELDSDGLSRGVYLRSGVGSDYWPALAMAMATHVNPMIRYHNDAKQHVQAPYMAVKSDYSLIPFAGPRGTYPAYSYLDVMADKVPAEVFRDKVVLIGAAAVGLGDTIPTPVTSLDSPLSGVEFHANVYSAIMNQSIIKQVEDHWIYLLTFAFIMIPILVFPRLGPTHVMPATVVLVALVASFSYVLLRYDNHWFPPINAILGILIAYPMWSWQRMRHLNRFFSLELERLGKEPDIALKSPGQQDEEQLFLSLLALLRPQQYLFMRNNHVLHCFDKEAFDTIQDYQEGYWTHDEQRSWIELTRGDTVICIALSWTEASPHEQLNRASIKAFLNHLDLSLPSTTEPTRYYEQVSNRIMQVRKAIQSMQDMRMFITKGFEEIPGAVLVTDPLGNIIYHNSRAVEWLSTENVPLMGSSVTEALKHQTEDIAKLEHAIYLALMGKQEHETELQLTTRDVLLHCLPFSAEDRTDEESTEAGMMLSMSDITPIKQEQREKNQLIDFLSHDVRSPLVSQLAMLQGLRSGRIEWQPDLINDIEGHAKRSLNLSEQFLQITRAEQISQDDFYDFDLLAVIENATDSIAPQASAKDISIGLKADDDAWFRGNAELIERSVINLLSNAVKYSPSQTKIDVTLEVEDGTAKLLIRDEGEGISADELPHIFDRFRRQKSTEIKGEKGAGLGLSFVRLVTDKHQIKLKVDSEKGQGTVFELNFPLVEFED